MASPTDISAKKRNALLATAHTLRARLVHRPTLTSSQAGGSDSTTPGSPGKEVAKGTRE